MINTKYSQKDNIVHGLLYKACNSYTMIICAFKYEIIRRTSAKLLDVKNESEEL